MKTCSLCQEDKRLSEFPKTGARCKSCRSKLNQQWLKSNPDKRSKYNKSYYRRNGKDKVRHFSLKRKYGLDPQQRDRLFEEQNKMCAICSSQNAVRWTVDHDHATGKVRGILCDRCNLGLGHFRDSIERLHAAIAYLQKQS